MKAMVLKEVIESIERNPKPLELVDLEEPTLAPHQILVRVSACGVCRTELDQIEGRISPPRLPIVLGHQIVGQVKAKGPRAKKFEIGERVGIAWINSACGTCKFCRQGTENLCPEFQGTGCHQNGGYAELTVVSEDYAYPIPDEFSDLEAAPLLCAGVIGYRSLRLSELKDGQNLGLYGFGASGHLVIQMAKYKYPNCKIFVFSRNPEERNLAKKLGAEWTGEISAEPPEKLDCAIDTTPRGEISRIALGNLEKGGILVINAIRKESPVPELDYTTYLWQEKKIKSVTNVTRSDVQEFLPLAAGIPIKPEIQEFGLEEANEALVSLKKGKIRGAKVLKIK